MVQWSVLSDLEMLLCLNELTGLRGLGLRSFVFLLDL